MWYNLFVANVFSSSSVLLTYKNKLLLLGPESHPNSAQPPLWSLISGLKGNKESNQDTIYRKIKYITGLELKNASLFPPFATNSTKCVYHAELTDKDVNSMDRREGQRLEFFTLAELPGLSLSPDTKAFLDENRVALQELLARD